VFRALTQTLHWNAGELYWNNQRRPPRQFLHTSRVTQRYTVTVIEWFATIPLVTLITRYVAYGSDTARKNYLLMSLSLLQPLWIRALTYSTSKIASETKNPADKRLDSYKVSLQRNVLTCTLQQQRFSPKTMIASTVGYHFPHYLSPCPSFRPFHFISFFFLALPFKFFSFLLCFFRVSLFILDNGD